MHLLKADGRSPLAARLDAVLAELAEGLGDRGRDARGCYDEDEDYIYMESDVAVDVEGVVDICIQGGRAFIRVTRGSLRGYVRGPNEEVA